MTLLVTFESVYLKGNVSVSAASVIAGSPFNQPFRMKLRLANLNLILRLNSSNLSVPKMKIGRSAVLGCHCAVLIVFRMC